MASKLKIDNAVLKRLERKEERGRRMGARKQRLSYLIMCEGAKTEKYYFNALKNELEKGVVTIEVFGTGRGNTSLLKYTDNYRKQCCKYYDQIWLVFDEDGKPGTFNQAINEARKKDYSVAYSNEAFELWYILHFEYCCTGINRKQYIDKLNRLLQEKYDKANPNMYHTLKKHQAQAIRRSEKLYKSYTTNPRNPAKEKPSTTVHILVSELNKYKINS